MNTFEIYLRTPESIWAVKDILSKILNYENQENNEHRSYTYYTLGTIISLEDIDSYDKLKVVKFEDDFIPLSTYDLKITLFYENHSFVRNRIEIWLSAFSGVILDLICNRLSCEGVVVENFDEVKERILPDKTATYKED